MIKLTLTQDAYYDGTADDFLNLSTADGKESLKWIQGPWYTASAKDEDGNEYQVYWKCRDDFDPNTDEDEGDAFVLYDPIQVFDYDNDRELIAAGIEFEIA